ncbi:DmX-like protein 1, partial [Quaeritorhiza haematococci]
GGKRGDIYAYDMRQRSVLSVFKGHERTVKAMAVDQETGSLLSGSIDGDVKIWDIRSISTVTEIGQRITPGFRSLRLPGEGGAVNNTNGGMTGTTTTATTGSYGVMQIYCVEGVAYVADAGTVRRARLSTYF